MNEDFRDMLAALVAHQCRFLVVGAHAMAVHGVPRATGDIDIWIESDPENARRAWRALIEFGAPVDSLQVKEADLTTPNSVIQIGLPPRRVDLLTSLTGLEFETAWRDRVEQRIGDLLIPFLGRDALLTNKRACDRTKDRADLEALGSAPTD